MAWRKPAPLCALGLLVLLSTTAAAQQRAAAGGTVPQTNGPAKPAFDAARFFPVLGVFETFHVTKTQTLRAALDARMVAEDTSLLVTDTGKSRLALLQEQMAFHHIAQGRTDGQDWLVSFCVVCNTGTRLVPTVDGKPTRFTTAGAYDALLVINDAATGTLWNHITGEAIHGPRLGSTLGPVGNALQMNVKQALALDPKMRVAISDRLYVAGGRVHGTRAGFLVEKPEQAGEQSRRASIRSTTTAADPNAALSAVFAGTLSTEDMRRARMELGLGIWTGTSRRFYPVEQIRQRGGALIDQIDGQRMLVYIDPETRIPAAFMVDSKTARMDGDTVRLDAGQRVKSGVLSNAKGARLTPQRPQQVFTRWYGFAATFPGVEVFGQPSGS